MTLIEGLSDEVFHFLIAFFVIGIVSFAWWTTNINEQRQVRTVLLLERTIRHRFHRRLTNHTEAITISEGTSDPQPVSEEVTPSEHTTTNTEQSSDSEKPPEASTSNSVTPEVDESMDGNTREEQSIINTMDADTCVLRQRRLAFYDNVRNGTQNAEPTTSHCGIPQPSKDSNESSGGKLEDSTNNCNVDDIKGTDSCKSGLTIKLKYINDDIRIVEGSFAESLEDFKKRHFEQELSANKLIRLIFNGQVLQPDTQTLKNCGLFDNCVVHCLVHPKRQSPVDNTIVESRSEGYSFPNANPLNLNQNREWDLGNFLFAFISLMLLAAWYFRYVYAHLYTVTATVGLILITGIFTIVLVGMYFPDNENFPNPTIHIRERVSNTVSPPRQ